jgi:hypothetical protein
MLKTIIMLTGVTALVSAASFQVDKAKLMKVKNDFVRAMKEHNRKEAEIVRPVVKPVADAFAKAAARIILNYGRIIPKIMRAEADYYEKKTHVSGNVECIAKCFYADLKYCKLAVNKTCARKCGRVYKTYTRAQTRSSAWKYKYA